MLRRVSIALVCVFVLTMDFSGLAQAAPGSSRVDLADTWSTSTEVSAGIPSGGTRINVAVANDSSSGCEGALW